MTITQLHSVEVKRATTDPLRSGNYYTIECIFSVWGEHQEVQKILDNLRSSAMMKFLHDLENPTKKNEMDEYQAEFILYQLGQTAKLLDQKKFDEAIILFKLVEQLMPEYQRNSRINEINDMRNMIWDSLAQRKLI